MTGASNRLDIVLMTDTDPLRPIRHPFAVAVSGLCGIVLTAALGVAIAQSAWWTTWETGTLSAIATTREPMGLALAHVIARVCSPTFGALITILIAVVIWVVTRSGTRALVFAIMVGVCCVATQVMKFVVQRPGPLPSVAVDGHTSLSFPSGHVTFVCAIVLALLLTVRDWRFAWVVVALGSVLVVLVTWSRMYLGVHFLTDGAGSVLLTVSVMALLIPLTFNVIVPAIPARPGHA